jgi:uncharacterized membrane protein
MYARDLVVCGALLIALSAPSAGAAVLDLSRDIDARGAKPDWTLKVRGGQFTLIRPGKPAVVASAPGAAISPGVANWSAKAADGQVMQVTLQTRRCTIGATQYPMTAQVKLGAEAMAGCADHTR